MSILPDLLSADLNVVFCGTAVSTTSAARGHYYSKPSNKFWQLLHDAGFTPDLLRPEDDVALPSLGIGITDLVKDKAQSHDRGLDYGKTTAVVAHIAAHAPRWVAFNGKAAGGVAAKALGQPKPWLGIQPWTIGTSRVFVLPSSSGANARRDYDGRPTKLEWWVDLARLVKEED